MASAIVWKRRAAFLYTVGAWTVFGYIALSFLKREDRYQKKEEEEGQQQQHEKKLEFGTSASEDSITETTMYGTPGSDFYVTTTVKYKANFVPYTTRLYNYIQSFFDDSAKKEK
ncbi:hypothetical protein JD844_017030 [Phrynosoma platyrhinos]|uniref:Small integral membrane protein 26 n=1 Tax=Phrynosoma platyrhinos TaxID=52577 RepID=A0ABQ7SL42_PHRPL|nr:hypothetical protein JD844_017030 [Phrynosoma platyrhinos]